MSEPKLVKDQPFYDVMALYIGETVTLHEFYDGMENTCQNELSIFTAENNNEGWMIGDFPGGDGIVFTPWAITKTEILIDNDLHIYLRD
jgi:hypothetical protein